MKIGGSFSFLLTGKDHQDPSISDPFRPDAGLDPRHVEVEEEAVLRPSRLWQDVALPGALARSAGNAVLAPGLARSLSHGRGHIVPAYWIRIWIRDSGDGEICRVGKYRNDSGGVLG